MSGSDRRTLLTREVLAAIRLGEDTGVDFKAVPSSRAGVFERDLADDLAAFANGRGGRLVLGVADKPRRLEGIPPAELDGLEQQMRQIASDRIEPPLHIDTWRIELPDEAGELRAVLVIEVPRSLFVHRSPGGYRKRYGASQRQLSTEELQRLLMSRSQSRSIGFDELPVPGSSAADLDPALTLRYTRAAQLDPVSLTKLHLLTADDDGQTRLSVAAALLCTTHPQQWLPGAGIQCVHYVSTVRADAAGQHDAQEFAGPLDAQIDAAYAWLQRQTRISAGPKQPWREDRPQYDPLALFEALVNAVVHRDYSIRGSRIRLHLFPDRLELHVPGALANTLTVDALDARQYVRNDLITSLLGRIGVPTTSQTLPVLGVRKYLERRGDGVPIILERSEQLSGRRPQYELIADSELKLTIYAAGVPQDD